MPGKKDPGSSFVEYGKATPTATPEGCVCTIDWMDETDFKRCYKTACPLAMSEHPKAWERPFSFFNTVLMGGFGYGKDPAGGIIRIDDGKVSFTVRSFRGETTC